MPFLVVYSGGGWLWCLSWFVFFFVFSWLFINGGGGCGGRQ
jgi:hypothetical protein